MRLIIVHFLLLLNFGMQIINAEEDSLNDYSASIITDQSVSSGKFADTGSVALNSTDQKMSHDDTQSPKLTPMTPDTHGTGALKITVYPKGTEVFINTEKIGIGNQYLKDLRSGFYKISLSYDNKSTSEYILIHSGEALHKNFVLSRKLHFIVESSFSNIWVKHNRSMGPSLDLGFQFENNYYGLNYFWNVVKSDTMTIGGSFLYYHDFNYKEILSICPGVCAGFWYSDGVERIENSLPYYEDYYPYYTEYYDEFFFGGLLAKAKFGYKRIFATFTYIFLIGTETGHGLQFGMQFKI